MLKRSPLAVFMAVALHLLIVFFLIYGLEWELFPDKAKPQVQVVKAQVVDTDKLKQKEAEEKAKLKQQQEEARKRKAEEEKKRQAAQEQKRKAEAEVKRQAEAERKAEAKRKAEAEAKQKAEAKRQAEAEAKRQAEAKRKAEAEAKQKAEAKRQAEAEAKRKAEEAAARAERERALQEQLAAEQNAREIDRYVAVIKQQIERKWLRPALTGQQLSCIVQVRLIPGGDVVPGGVTIIKSSGNAAFDRSVEAAVYKAAPLQVPSGGLFEQFRTFKLDFKPSK